MTAWHTGTTEYATRHPASQNRTFVQNGNACNEGIENNFWKNVKAAYKQPQSPATTRYDSSQHLGHVQPLLDRDGNQDIRMQMFYSYGTNPPLYPAWQEYLRTYQPPTLIVWGQNDEIFPAAGAEPYKRDLADLGYHLIDTGQELTDLMRDFLNRKVGTTDLAAN